MNKFVKYWYQLIDKIKPNNNSNKKSTIFVNNTIQLLPTVNEENTKKCIY